MNSETDFRTEEARAEAERAAAADESVPGGTPGEIDDEAMRAADGLSVPEDVKRNYREATERGASAKGEGRIP